MPQPFVEVPHNWDLPLSPQDQAHFPLEPEDFINPEPGPDGVHGRYCSRVIIKPANSYKPAEYGEYKCFYPCPKVPRSDAVIQETYNLIKQRNEHHVWAAKNRRSNYHDSDQLRLKDQYTTDLNRFNNIQKRYTAAFDTFYTKYKALFVLIMVFNRKLVGGFEGDFKLWWISQIFHLLTTKPQSSLTDRRVLRNFIRNR